MDNGLPSVLPAEFAGVACLDHGVLNVGGVEVRLPVAWTSGPAYGRRMSDDLTVAEVLTAVDGSLVDEQLAAENSEADRYGLGPREYWRSKSVGTPGSLSISGWTTRLGSA